MAPPALDKAPVEQRNYDQARPDLTTGDLLCFRSTDIDARIIRFLTRSQYSHVGMVFLYEGRVYVLEATSRGMQLVLLSRRAKFYNGGIDYFRIEGVTEEQRRGAVGWAFQRLGMPYNFMGIVRFLWFLLSGSKERIRQRNGWFCSEIIAEAYRRA